MSYESILPWIARSPTATRNQQEELLNEAEKCLAFLSERRATDRELKKRHAHVLTELGALHLLSDCNAAEQELEKAASLWGSVPAESRSDLAGYAVCCFLLEQVHDRLGHAGRAQEVFAAGFRAWQALTREPPRGLAMRTLVSADLEMGWILVKGSSPGKEVAERLRTIRRRLHQVTGTAAGDVFFDLVQVGYWHREAQNQEPMGPLVTSLSGSRKAASILSRLLSQTDLEENLRAHLACIAFLVSIDLRRGPALEEALRLSRQANRTLQRMLSGSANKDSILDALSESWFEMSKVHWELGQTEETLTACRNALKAAREAFVIDPTVPGRQESIADRYLRLGRKLCELGRLDEAEACFREREKLWPGNTAKQKELLEQIRSWAAKVGKDRNSLSPKEQEERGRYLDLAARLERKGRANPGEQHHPNPDKPGEGGR